MMGSVQPVEPAFAAPSMQFKLAALSANTLSRLGQLTFIRPGATTTAIATPALVAYTRRGAPPHLTRDNVARLPIEMVSLSLEHFLDGPSPAFVDAPFSLHRFVGLHPSRQLVTLGLRDPSDHSVLGPNNDNWATCRTNRGAVRVTPADFLAWSLPRPPDILFALADDPVVEAMSLKRLRKSIARTTRWVTEVAVGAKGKVAVFAPLVGSTSVTQREQFCAALLDGSEGPAVDDAISGYVLDVGTALPNALDAHASPTALFNASLTTLPSQKPRTALEAAGPHAILRLVRDVGIDLFVDEWSSHCATVGVGLDFHFPVRGNPRDTLSPKATETGKLDIGHNFFGAEFATAFVPLSTSQLATLSPVREHPFGPVPPTRGYVHHLLHSHEMTAHVILALHNQTVMHAFLAAVRALLAEPNDVFAAAVEAFFDTYDEGLSPFCGSAYPCIVAAREEYDRVNNARGRGSLKAKRLVDLEEASFVEASA